MSSIRCCFVVISGLLCLLLLTSKPAEFTLWVRTAPEFVEACPAERAMRRVPPNEIRHRGRCGQHDAKGQQDQGDTSSHDQRQYSTGSGPLFGPKGYRASLARECLELSRPDRDTFHRPGTRGGVALGFDTAGRRLTLASLPTDVTVGAAFVMLMSSSSVAEASLAPFVSRLERGKRRPARISWLGAVAALSVQVGSAFGTQACAISPAQGFRRSRRKNILPETLAKV